MKNSEVKIGIAVRVKYISSPWMIVIAKTPGIIGSSMVSCMWFSREDVQQNGVFKAEQLEGREEFLAELAKITSWGATRVTLEDIEGERVKMQAVKRAEGDGTGFVKFGDGTELPTPSSEVTRP